jgi:hypothetical protein
MSVSPLMLKNMRCTGTETQMDAMVEIEVRFSECASGLLFWNQDKT